MRTTQSFFPGVVVLPSVGVGERSWNTVSAVKVAPLLAAVASPGVSLVTIGRHALLAFDDVAEALSEADAKSSFRVL
jgi:hypothetical protein